LFNCTFLEASNGDKLSEGVGMKWLWVDPPDGWLYGFPKIISVETADDLTDWDKILDQHGYPSHKYDTLPLKMWEATDEDVMNFACCRLTSSHKIL
jgi:hypothetical protein